MTATALEALGVALIALGIATTAVTVYGVVRMSGLYTRLQAASKASMLGAVAILAASVGTRDGATIARAVVVALFLLLTTPVAAHAIAQAAYRRDREASRSSEEEAAAEADASRRTPNSSSRSTSRPITAPNCDS
ncbi:MAG TPA: monovalent cation/H(+) antiporter subunit G [Conexibacter sp.]|nr:monovalent cation/H(+) antiporter subunit G [Conexibacter sp.]